MATSAAVFSSRQRLFLGMSTVGAVLFLTLAVSSVERMLSHQGVVELESSDMKTIDKMLSHIHSLTMNYHPAHSHSKHSHSSTSHESNAHAASTSSSSSHHHSSSHHLAVSLKHQHRKAAALEHLAAHHHEHSKSASSHHQNKALQEAESAEDSLKKSGTGAKVDSSAEKKKRAEIAAKMKALQAKINNDFASVMKRGKKAGYLPPIQMPHM